MGYYTTVEGDITITPPLTWNEFKDSPFNPQGTTWDRRMNVKLRVIEDSVDTDEGQLVRRTATAIVPAISDTYKAYYLVEHTQKAIDSFSGHVFSGHLECSGEENGDLWRCVIRNGRAVKVEPRIVWPGDDPAY